jgi:hypothetical protein
LSFNEPKLHSLRLHKKKSTAKIKENYNIEELWSENAINREEGKKNAAKELKMEE